MKIYKLHNIHNPKNDVEYENKFEKGQTASESSKMVLFISIGLISNSTGIHFKVPT